MRAVAWKLIRNAKSITPAGRNVDIKLGFKNYSKIKIPPYAINQENMMHQTEKPQYTQLLLSQYALWGFIFFLMLAVIPSFLKVPEPWYGILLNLGTSLLISLTISNYINEKVKHHTNTELESLINKKFPFLLESETAGLHKLVYGNDLKSYGIDIVNSENLYIAMNDGKNFMTNNSGLLSERLKKKGKLTVVILLDDESAAEKQLSEKNGKESNHYKTKILDTIKTLKDYHKYGAHEHKLEIYKHKFSLQVSIVVTDNEALVGLYRNSKGKFEMPPSLLFSSNGSEYKNIFQDLTRLKESSSLVPIRQ